jgi:SAM-dependent methyltransferase
VLLNRTLEAEGCTPVPFNPHATEQAYLESVDIEAGRRYVVYGAGSMGAKVQQRIERLGGTVTGFADRDAAKQASGFNGRAVHAPSELGRVRRDVHRIVIGTSFLESALDLLMDLGLRPDDDVLVPLDIEGRNEGVAAPARKKVVLFGASSLGRHAAAELGGDHDVVGFVDNDSAKWGTLVSGHVVRSPGTLRPGQPEQVIVTSTYVAEIQAQLRALGVEHTVFTPRPQAAPAVPADAAFECPVCERPVAEWVPFRRRVGDSAWRVEPGGRLCPHCRSFERTRHIVLHLAQTRLLESRPRFLHVAPEKGLAVRLRRVLGDRYVTGDLDMEGVDIRLDLTDTTLPDAAFDVVYCSNVLEHIPDDAKAMRELARILRPGGLAIVQVPVKGQVTLEDPSIVDPARRTELFGQADHVRFYGRDIRQRLERAGFTVAEVEMPDALGLTPDEQRRFNCGKRELVHFCTKTPVVAAQTAERGDAAIKTEGR